MAEKKLPTTTIIEYKPDYTVDIIARYEGGDNDTLPNILSSNISDIQTNLNGIAISEGDLYMRIKNYPDQIQIQVDSNGNLVVFLYNPEERDYVIDVDPGMLLYVTEDL